MRKLVAGFVVMAGPLAWGQMHKVAKPEQVVRAVGVYEWTGELDKPKGERLVPVTIFINGSVEDAAVYLARPVPLALLTGNLYELDEAGVEKGLLDLKEARHVQIPAAADLVPYDDGWFGYGSYVAPAIPKAAAVHKPTTTLLVNGKPADDPDKPHLSSKSAQPGSGEGTQPVKGSPEDVKVDAGSGEDKDNVDRPTLRRRPAADPAQAKKDRKKAGESSVVAEKGSLNDDPDRPTIKRGHKEDVEEFPALSGLPADMKQMVAVSDPKRREVHPFARAWEDDAEHQAVLTRMRAMARAELVKYGPVPPEALAASQLAATMPAAAGPAPAAGPVLSSQDTSGGAPVLKRNKVAADAAAKEQVTAAVPAVAPVKMTTAKTSQTPAARRAAALKAKKTSAAAKPVQEALLDEDVRGFTLSYGGAPTYVYTARTAGTGAALRYVTIVAQADGLKNEELKMAMHSVTDASHLDRTAWMRFVDVVDVEASNRASLLFELRGQSARQFALYRVIGAKADTVFTGGTTQ